MRFIFADLGRNNPAFIEDIKQAKKTLIAPNPRATFQVVSARQAASCRSISQRLECIRMATVDGANLLDRECDARQWTGPSEYAWKDRR